MGEKKEPVSLAVFFSTLCTHHVSGKNPKLSFSEPYLSPWLLEETSVVQMWDGESGLRWHWPCGCFGAGAHSAVGYRCLLSSINVANMWNHGTHNTTQRSTPLIVWEITPSWRNFFLKGWNKFLNRRSFFRGLDQERDAWGCWTGYQVLYHRVSTVLGVLPENRSKKCYSKPEIHKCQVPHCACRRKLVHSSHRVVSLEMSSVNLGGGCHLGWFRVCSKCFHQFFFLWAVSKVGRTRENYTEEKENEHGVGWCFLSSITKTLCRAQKFLSLLAVEACASFELYTWESWDISIPHSVSMLVFSFRYNFQWNSSL